MEGKILETNNSLNYSIFGMASPNAEQTEGEQHKLKASRTTLEVEDPPFMV